MEFIFEFSVLPADATIGRVRAVLKALPAGALIVLIRNQDLYYVYTQRELLGAIGSAGVNVSVTEALGLHEHNSVWAVDSDSKLVAETPAELRTLTFGPPKSAAVLLKSGGGIRAVIKGAPVTLDPTQFANSIAEAFKTTFGYGQTTSSRVLGGYVGTVTEAAASEGLGGAAHKSEPFPSPPGRPTRRMRGAPQKPPFMPPARKKNGKKPEPKEGKEITRWPLVEPEGPARPGQELSFKVDLKLRRPAKVPVSARVTATFSETWREETVQVRLSSPLLEFAPGAEMGSILVRRDQESVPCELKARLATDTGALEEFEVLATFSYKGRFSGSCRTVIPIVNQGGGISVATTRGGARPAPALAPQSKQSVGKVVLEKAAAPDLTIHIQHFKMAGSQVFCWTLEPRERWAWLPPELTDVVPLANDPRQQLEAMLTSVAAKTNGHEEFLEGLGMRIYDVTPPAFKKLYWSMREHRGKDFSIQFITNEPSIPWELMRPYQEQGTEGELLVKAHPVARWLSKYEGFMPSRMPSGTLVTIAPEYEERSRRGEIEDLPIAVEVSEELKRDFKAKHVNGTFTDLLSLLKGNRDESVAILHVGAHGKFVSVAPDASVLYLDDDDLQPAQVRVPSTRLGERDRTFVIFNACEVGKSEPMMETVGGWADAFLLRRFSGFIAPLWSVYDDDAGEFSTQLLKRIWQDRPRKAISEALRDIRNEFGQRSATFFSYVYYGDVMAKFE